MILHKFIFLSFLILYNSDVFAISDFQQAVDDFAESFDELVPAESFNPDKEEISLSYASKEPVDEIKHEKEDVQLVGNEYNFDVTPSVWDKAAQELQKINTELVLVNVTSVTGQVTNDVSQTMELLVYPKDCTEDVCHYACKLEFHSRGTEETVLNTCTPNVEKRERRTTVAIIKKKVDAEEAKALADFAVDTLDMFDVDSKKRIVKEIISATKQLSNGVSYDLVMHVAVVECDESSSQCDDIVDGTENLCKVKLYRSFENNSTYKLTQSDCTPLDVIKSKLEEDSKPKGLVGGWTSANVDDELVKNLTNFSLPRVRQQVNAPGLKLVEVVSAKLQVVSGMNVQLKLKLEDKLKKTYLCDVSLFEKPWMDIREVSDVKCNPIRNKRTTGGIPGGYSPVDPKDKMVLEVVDFSLPKVSQQMNAPGLRVTEIVSAKSQVVAGQNFKVRFIGKDDNNVEYSCEVTVFDQPWTNTRKVTDISCERYTKSKRSLGGWNNDSPNSDFIKELAKFSLIKVQQKINSRGVSLIEIISAKSQVVSGRNVQLSLKIADDGKATYLCDVSLYDQPWTKTREVTDLQCSPISTNRRKRGDTVFGRWKAANVSSPFIEDAANFSMFKVRQAVDAKEVVLEEIVAAKTKVVSGQNIRLILKVKDENKVRYVCDVTLYEQPWTYRRRVSYIECNPEKSKRKRRDDKIVGGYTQANTSDPFIIEIAKSSLLKVAQHINKKDVVLGKILNAETQVVSGLNIKLEFDVNAGTDVYTCQVIVYDQSWTKTRIVSDIKCSLDKNKDKVITGGWTNANVNDTIIQEMAKFGMERAKEYVDARNLTMTDILSAKTQVVSGINYDIKTKSQDAFGVIYICDILIYDQPWTNTRRITSISCEPETKNPKKRSHRVVGGYTPITDKNQISQYADFSLSQIAESETVNSPSGVKLMNVNKAEKQVVAGLNIRLDMSVKTSNDATFNCVVVIWEQAWRNFKEVIDLQCNPAKVSKNKLRK